MGFNRADLAGLPPGFGFLVPVKEGRSMLACTFVHAKFAGRTPPDKGVLRCFLGGSGNEHLLDETDAHLTEIVLKELSEILGLRATPNFVRICRSRHAMAQYGVGHLERMQIHPRHRRHAARPRSRRQRLPGHRRPRLHPHRPGSFRVRSALAPAGSTRRRSDCLTITTYWPGRLRSVR
jgi:hypothetical protein